MVRLTDLVAPSFYGVHSDLKAGAHTHYLLGGGRGSTKSSFVSIEIILGIMSDENANAVALRKVGKYLKDSVFSQLKWAIDILGVSDYWKLKQSPLEMIYEKTGQRIMFRGADDPAKIKSIKADKGYIKYIWFEELDQFSGPAEIRSINQSLMRGGDRFAVFYSYNPPKRVRSWVNRGGWCAEDNALRHSSTYLDVPPEWIGERFILEAEQVKKTRPRIYENEYLGIVTGIGGEVFTNIHTRDISDEEIAGFDKIRCGVDFGYAADPFVFLQCAYDKNKLWIFDEVYKFGMSNAAAAEEIGRRSVSGEYIICDSAEPKSIRDFRERGLRVRGAKKGPDSIGYGIKFLQSLDEIIIDRRRCPNSEREFSEYELERDVNGDFKAAYPDRNNHTIDAARYALESEISRTRARIVKRREMGI